MKLTQKVLTLWVIALCVMLVGDWLESLLDSMDRSLFLLSLITFGARVLFIFFSAFLVVLAIRWMLRRLFWRVGRRLALSYFLIGVMPFVLFAILMLVIGYCIAGVLSQTTFRIERLNALARMNQWNLEYELTGERPAGALSSLEVYDSRDASGAKMPKWLRSRTFHGLASRGDEILLVSAKVYQLDGKRRAVTLAQPVNDEFIADLRARSGMSILPTVAQTRREKVGDVHVGVRVKGDDERFEEFTASTLFRRGEILWFDINLNSPLYDWNNGEASDDHRMVTALSNPVGSLLNFYFGNSQYVAVMARIIAGIAAALFVVYMFAALLAVWLIVSITRAVNRIEKGTKAVERGDFSYRIRMKPTNQLGEVAHSFNRMTESIASLLDKVAEQERLQSEIDIAAAIQRNLLPREGPQNRGVSFSAHFEPTASIGGDYYDVFNIDRSHLAVAIGDVSGHGLSTGLVMAMVKAAITTLVEEGTDTNSLFIRLNDLVMRSTEKRAFMTLGFTLFDLEHSRIRHTNAGHLFPYVLRNGGIPRAIEAASLPLGIRPLSAPKTVECDLLEGDAIVYYSDGIIEALDGNGEPFGFDRLEKVLASVSDKSAVDIQAAVLEAVRLFTSGRPSEDDRTVMVLRFDSIGTARTASEVEADDEPLPDESTVYVTGPR